LYQSGLCPTCWYIYILVPFRIISLYLLMFGRPFSNSHAFRLSLLRHILHPQMLYFHCICWCRYKHCRRLSLAKFLFVMLYIFIWFNLTKLDLFMFMCTRRLHFISIYCRPFGVIFQTRTQIVHGPRGIGLIKPHSLRFIIIIIFITWHLYSAANRKDRHTALTIKVQ